jgi:hypothetical protein
VDGAVPAIGAALTPVVTVFAPAVAVAPAPVLAVVGVGARTPLIGAAGTPV